MELEDSFVHIRAVQERDLEPLRKVADADGHAIIAPAYVVEKNHQMVGYVGMCPSVLIWMDTQRTKVRDSVCVLNFFENMLANNGTGIFSLPCSEKSPLRKFIPKVGYTSVGSLELFMKNLKHY